MTEKICLREKCEKSESCDLYREWVDKSLAHAAILTQTTDNVVPPKNLDRAETELRSADRVMEKAAKSQRCIRFEQQEVNNG